MFPLGEALWLAKDPTAQALTEKGRWGGEGERGTAGSPGFPIRVGAVRRNHPGQLGCSVTLRRWGRSCQRTDSAAHSGTAPSVVFAGWGIPPSGSLGSPEPVSEVPTGRRGTASGAGAGAWRAGGRRCGLGVGSKPPSWTRLFPPPSRRKARRTGGDRAIGLHGAWPAVLRSFGAEPGGAAGAQRTTLRSRLCL